MSGPGWINTNLQSQIQWRPDDVVISVPAKSGTTWTMNIVYQLREKGNRNFDDIYEELKWIEASLCSLLSHLCIYSYLPIMHYVHSTSPQAMDSPTATEADMIHKIDTFTPHKPRAFKTHSSPPALPFRSDVKYLVVVRNPEEVVVSFKSFAAKHSPDFLRWWGVPPEAFDFPDVDSFYKGFCKGSEFDLGLFKFVEEWMKRRDEPNVMMIHYSVGLLFCAIDSFDENVMLPTHKTHVSPFSILGYGQRSRRVNKKDCQIPQLWAVHRSRMGRCTGTNFLPVDEETRDEIRGQDHMGGTCFDARGHDETG